MRAGGRSAAAPMAPCSSTRPRGKPLAQKPPREPVDDALVWMREWADERGLDLGPDVNMPQWDGTKPDYDLAVSGLLEAT